MNNTVPETGRYCPIARELTLLNPDGTCSGVLVRKGNGVLPEKDEYGKEYRTTCRRAIREEGMLIIADQQKGTIVGCI